MSDIAKKWNEMPEDKRYERLRKITPPTNKWRLICRQLSKTEFMGLNTAQKLIVYELIKDEEEAPF